MEENRNLTIKQWAEDDRPREKMLSKGASSLSNAELVAILIATGSKTESALDLGKALLSKSSNNLDEICKLTPLELSKRVKGIGKAKAVTISAAIELGVHPIQSKGNDGINICPQCVLIPGWIYLA